jgi:hypothetical protein
MLPTMTSLGPKKFPGAGHAAVGVDAVPDDYVPEVRGGGVVLGIVALVEDIQVADELRDVLVGVLAVDHVLVGGGGVQEGGVVEAPRRHQVVLVAGQGVQVGEDVVHRVVLAADVGLPHRVELRPGEASEPAVGPVRHAEYVQNSSSLMNCVSG